MVQRAKKPSGMGSLDAILRATQQALAGAQKAASGTVGGNSYGSMANRSAANTVANAGIQYLGSGGGGGYSGGGYSGGGGGSYGGSLSGGGGGGGAAPAPAPAPKPISDADWLAKDTGYLATIKALEAQQKAFEADNGAQRSKGVLDYDTSLKRLGWINPSDDGDGSWNRDDRTTSYGNAWNGQQGDFASRGMLQSSLYDQAQTDLLSEFGRQKTEMDTTQKSFLEDLARALSNKKTETQQSKDQSRIEALARRAAEAGA